MRPGLFELVQRLERSVKPLKVQLMYRLIMNHMMHITCGLMMNHMIDILEVQAMM